MVSGPVSGKVFIWYPGHGNIGHASMYLGNIAIGEKFEMTLDVRNRSSYRSLDQQEVGLLTLTHYNDNYVSWWPKNVGGNVSVAAFYDRASPSPGLWKDVQRENFQKPHVAYDVYGLDVPEMRQTWLRIRDAKGARYDGVRKNCADIVLRVLLAGGAGDKLSFLKRMYYANNVITKPRDVAAFCNQLRDAGYAEKTKTGTCPEKNLGSFGWMALGLR